ncbi:MAG: methyltransferase domain-containing protein [Pseudomonadota bacterium]
MTRNGTEGDLGVFFGQLLRRPWRVVALAPSSTGLCREMTAELGPTTGPVVELGAGTGRITQAILDRGVPEENLTLLEMNTTFCALLEERFPKARVLPWKAQDVAKTGVQGAGAVVSGLPLLSMPTSVQRAIVGGTFEVLRPGGIFVQFTYGGRPPIEQSVREDLGLSWERSRRVWWNLPPAHAYTFRRFSDQTAAAA